ncbi:MAG: hypothetical protein AVDCRST_MAG93-8499, partial [uncultured Chloroflexia bacterium]
VGHPGRRALRGVGIPPWARNLPGPKVCGRRLGFHRPRAVLFGGGWPLPPVGQQPRKAPVAGDGPRRVRVGLGPGRSRSRKRSRVGVFRAEGLATLSVRLVIVYAHRPDALGHRHGEQSRAATVDGRGDTGDGGVRLDLRLDRQRRRFGGTLGAHRVRAAIRPGLGGVGNGALGDKYHAKSKTANARL